MYLDNYQPFIAEYYDNVDLQNAIKYSGTIDNAVQKQWINFIDKWLPVNLN